MVLNYDIVLIAIDARPSSYVEASECIYYVCRSSWSQVGEIIHNYRHVRIDLINLMHLVFTQLPRFR